MINKLFWLNKRVFITGHTGFKGSWLCMILEWLGAKTAGYSLHPNTGPSLFNLCQLENTTTTFYSDIRDLQSLKEAIESFDPDIIIHMAAQPLVRYSYKNPIETYEVNVMGTANLLEVVRGIAEKSKKIRAIINVTTDKCYENKEWLWGYRENEPLGGFDPYSSSKACSELVTSSYRNSYFNSLHYDIHQTGVASARAGNVIGGGDWCEDRLIPDCVRALIIGETIKVRYPLSIRPWQHVLEPLNGYLMLAEKLYEQGSSFAEAWNFGPEDADAKHVEWIVKQLCDRWGNQAKYEVQKGPHPHEAHFLKLDCSKSKTRLGWYPKWKIGDAIDAIVDWTSLYQRKSNMKEVSLKQINDYYSS